MKLTFRWYGDGDPVTLDKIRQIPQMSGIVSAIYDVAPGEVWSNESILELKRKANENGLEFEVVESVPVPEEIKYGGENAPQLIENYCENIRRLGKAGVKCICYNFMPVFDWLRSRLERIDEDGSNSLAYNENEVLAMNPLESELSLPGWDESYSRAELAGLIEKYKKIGKEGLWKNLTAFLTRIIPVAHEAGVNMAIHPDDPPWDIFGLPRIITDIENIRRFLDIVPLKENGITFCTGSLGASASNDLVEMAGELAPRVHFLHLRNILITGEREFHEVGHPTECGSLDMFGIVRALLENGFDGYVRPDHGRMIWGERGRYGYGLFDRALGATYIVGLFEAIQKMMPRESD
ncbi:MAG: mannonate dehydratase [Clostridia bacterium]|nr:mannonate dehydratase [Clostridia bacterium]